MLIWFRRRRSNPRRFLPDLTGPLSAAIGRAFARDREERQGRGW